MKDDLIDLFKKILQTNVDLDFPTDLEQKDRNPVISIPPLAGWTPASPGVPPQETFYEIIKLASEKKKKS